MHHHHHVHLLIKDDALVGHRTCDLQVAGSSPGWAPLCMGLEQATYRPASVTHEQYNLVPAKEGDLFGWESNLGPGRK